MGTDLQRMGSGEMFDAIAARYDLLNRVLSLGIDRVWRRRTVDALELGPNARVLDLATGTADLALAIARRHGDARVFGTDPSERMLAIGARKVARAQLAGRVGLELGAATHIEHEDGSFDAVTIAFGIRNVPDRPRALREMARVTKPTGRIAILELGEPEGGVLGPFARLHIRHVVPWLGGWLSGSKEYRYLQQSVAAFPPPADFVQTMRESGIEPVEVRPLTFGVCNLYVGRPASAEAP